MKGIIFFVQSNLQSIWGDISAWSNTLDKLMLDFYIMVDESEVEKNWVETKRITGHRVTTFDKALTLLKSTYPECETVFMTELGDTELKDFTHPTNACYVVGADSGTEPRFIANHRVKMFPNNLWAIQVITSTIYDRFSKGV